MVPGSILLVEDDRDIREILSDLLEDEGYEVRQAENGADALEMLRVGCTPSVILLDLMMPIMDGAEFRREQLRDPKLAGIPVVLFTADAQAARSSELLGVAGVIVKPVSVADVIHAVSHVCG